MTNQSAGTVESTSATLNLSSFAANRVFGPYHYNDAIAGPGEGVPDEIEVK